MAYDFNALAHINQRHSPRDFPPAFYFIGDTYTGHAPAGVSLLAGLGASLATVTLYILVALLILPGVVFS